MTTTILHPAQDEYDRLFAQALQGDTVSAERLYARCVPSLAGWLAQRFGQHMAHEAAHEAMAEAFRQGDQFQPRGSFCGWLWSIGWHRALKTLRTETRRKAREEIYSLCERSTHAVELHDRHLRLVSLLARLPSSQRELLVLHYVQGKSSRDIAALHGRTRSAVAVNLHRLCRRLRAQLLAPTANIQASAAATH
ncbi:RNA polymerase sigma factor [Prosthecobacter vanneervenii]|uniref:RNA polymerase sigma-70 factor (ECF subfamily) n=1 Tax=Prosthecobacter vanneervenii TaxID=48466 RepID=A0A7W7YAA3_9BACT|nr:sigma-70 family RNA polymerase sigma factor [Prosthecobacter vanneervenii]MBB5032518.1 RNA polymerase sigma-70 factor (ECF subfamily) [Prosthecobacter vanneervenii]